MNNFFKNIKSKKPTGFINSIIDQENMLSDYEKKMINNIITLSTITVKEIMVPRVDVIAIDKNIGIEKIIEIVEEKGRSRLPVFDDNYDNIFGILHSKDLLKYFINPDDFELTKIIRSAYFVPESKPINDLLVEMREKKIHLSIVVNEYGGISGIVCLEDIIERIIGEIQDEFDDEMEDFVTLSDKKFLINARVSLDDLNEFLSSNFEEEADTLGGLVYRIFGKIPLKNEKISYNDYIFTIESITERKITRVIVEVPGLGGVLKSDNEVKGE